MKNLRLGSPLDKSIDMGAIIDKKTAQKISGMVSQTQEKSFKLVHHYPKKDVSFLQP